MRSLVALAVSVALTGCTGPAEAKSASPRVRLVSQGVSTRDWGDLRVAPRSRARYARAAFGDWSDPDRNGCAARDDVLRRDLRRVVLRSGSKCFVASGELLDPYTGQLVPFTRGPATSGAVQIDHVVPVSDAWASGAWAWTPARRVAFYSDPLNLVAVKGAVNSAKGAKTAERFLPARGACAYARTQLEVKAKYSLTVTADELTAMRGACR